MTAVRETTGTPTPIPNDQRPWRLDRVVLVAIAAFAILRLAALTRYPLWTDETWTLRIGDADFRRLLRIHADDQTHPPLFYVVLWVWRRIGPDSFAWQRLLPCLAGTATAVAVVALARAAKFTARATWLGVLIAAGSGFLVAYSVEVRSYAFLALATTASLALWLRARDADAPRLTGLTAANLLLVYSHYFGVFVVLVEWLDAVCVARKRLRAMTRSAVVTALALVPWVWRTIQRAEITGARLEVVSWIPKPIAGDMLDVVRDTVGGFPWPLADLGLAIAVVALVSAWLLRTRHHPHAPLARVLVLAVLVPVVTAFAVSVAGPRPVWVTRYLISVAPPLALLLAGAIDWALPRRLTSVAVALACVPGALTAWSLVRGTAKPRYDVMVREIAAVERARKGTAAAQVPTVIPVFTLGGVSAWPTEFAVRRLAGHAAAARLTTHDITLAASVPARSGWVVWSERHPPQGITPTAALVRQGLAIDTTLGFAADLDSLVAVRFSARSPR